MFNWQKLVEIMTNLNRISFELNEQRGIGKAIESRCRTCRLKSLLGNDIFHFHACT